jgi:hypothetical protein
VELLYGEHDETLDLLLHAGLPIKTTQKKPKKNHVKNPLKIGFLGFFKFLIFYEDNTKYSL